MLMTVNMDIKIIHKILLLLSSTNVTEWTVENYFHLNWQRKVRKNTLKCLTCQKRFRPSTFKTVRASPAKQLWTIRIHWELLEKCLGEITEWTSKVRDKYFHLGSVNLHSKYSIKHNFTRNRCVQTLTWLIKNILCSDIIDTVSQWNYRICLWTRQKTGVVIKQMSLLKICIVSFQFCFFKHHKYMSAVCNCCNRKYFLVPCVWF